MTDHEVSAWHGVPVEEWRRRWGVPRLHVFETVGSTNDVARDLASAGAPEGTTVLADQQTRGRGRRGRVWHSGAGQSLILSMIARPGAPGAEAILSLRLGLAVARAIEAVTPLAVGIKWPNDLMLHDRKVGGMLCEGAVEGDHVAFVVAGAGVNVLQDDGWSAPLIGRATSLASWVDPAPGIPELAGRVIAEWLDTLPRGGDRLGPRELEEYDRRDVLKGRCVRVDGEITGTALGIDPGGVLRLDDHGTRRRVLAGTVRVAEAQEGGTP
jgi:BirA family biotin operon repressor/biotin-[acetyl-CoA-carboxylase] ligase